jgi:glycosyltransferase involved in cell wall biosynthesis
LKIPRALVVEPAGNLWGSERALLDLLGSVAGSPWQIAVCCPPNTPIVERLAKLPVLVYPSFVAGLHRKSRFQRLWAVAGLLAAALRCQPNLLHVNQAGATRIALAVGRVLRIPVVAHVRLAEDVSYLESLGAAADALPLLVCVSRYIRNLFEDWTPDARQRLVVLYDPYRPQRDWEDPSLQESRSTEPVLACVGRLAKSKGQDVLVQAIGHLKQSGTLASGHFFGTGERGDSFGLELAQLAARLGIADRIHWHGYQEEILSSIVGVAALVCPSYAESLGRVIFEAWDAGTIPVAWAGSGGPAEVIAVSEAGLLYTEQTGASLARTLQRVLELSSSARQEMVERGRKWLLSNSDPAIYGERMVSLWQGAAHP